MKYPGDLMAYHMRVACRAQRRNNMSKGTLDYLERLYDQAVRIIRYPRPYFTRTIQAPIEIPPSEVKSNECME